jgi:hypothetical protein
MTGPNGRRFHPLAPKSSEIHIHDIARSLARQPRFFGLTSQKITVGQHCCIVYDIALASVYGNEPRFLVSCLLHDAEEAYAGDMAAPIKCQMDFDGYREIVDRISQAIDEHYGINTRDPRIKQFDMMSLAAEVRQCCWNNPDMIARVSDLDDGGIVIENWSERTTFMEFLDRFDHSMRFLYNGTYPFFEEVTEAFRYKHLHSEARRIDASTFD